MTIEIKTSTLEPVRNTYRHIENRFGDKPATRYQEASYDVQATTNFHYKPTWQPEKLLNDPGRTAIEMNDWYVLKDPRQFYYGTYVQQRAKMQEVAESNYSFFEKRDLARFVSDEIKEKLITLLIPLRHVDHTANLNNVNASAYGTSTILTQAMIFYGMDRLGIAQYLSRIGLILDGNTGELLNRAKESWMNDSELQGLRALCEESLLVADWYELFLVQDLLIDSLVYDIAYRQFDELLATSGAQDVSMLTEFMQQWHKDANRWLDNVVKTTAAESEQNLNLMNQWIADWRPKVEAAIAPFAEALVGPEALAAANEQLNKRLKKVGLGQ